MDSGPWLMTRVPRKRAGDEIPELPRHLAALVGALKGPSDLGRNHDKYLAYPDRDEDSGAASRQRGCRAARQGQVLIPPVPAAGRTCSPCSHPGLAGRGRAWCRRAARPGNTWP
jgi:hypothetical protein